MNSEIYKKKFDNIYYKSTYDRYINKNEKKAFKDIVGECYEDFRKSFYTDLGFNIVNSKKIFGTTYNADIALEKNGVIKIVEECKGHYVDSCFLGRAIKDFAKIIKKCLDDKIEVPVFILSCPTKMNNFLDIFNEEVELFREDIKEIIKTNFIYHPTCNHGRLPKDKYFKSDNHSFELCDSMIDSQILFIQSI
jgi:hypothetical protein